MDIDLFELFGRSVPGIFGFCAIGVTMAVSVNASQTLSLFMCMLTGKTIVQIIIVMCRRQIIFTLIAWSFERASANLVYDRNAHIYIVYGIWYNMDDTAMSVSVLVLDCVTLLTESYSMRQICGTRYSNFSFYEHDHHYLFIHHVTCSISYIRIYCTYILYIDVRAHFSF